MIFWCFKSQAMIAHCGLKLRCKYCTNNALILQTMYFELIFIILAQLQYTLCFIRRGSSLLWPWGKNASGNAIFFSVKEHLNEEKIKVRHSK